MGLFGWLIGRQSSSSQLETARSVRGAVPASRPGGSTAESKPTVSAKPAYRDEEPPTNKSDFEARGFKRRRAPDGTEFIDWPCGCVTIKHVNRRGSVTRKQRVHDDCREGHGPSR